MLGVETDQEEITNFITFNPKEDAQYRSIKYEIKYQGNFKTMSILSMAPTSTFAGKVPA